MENATIAFIRDDEMVIVLSYIMGTKQETARMASNGKKMLDSTR